MTHNEGATGRAPAARTQSVSLSQSFPQRHTIFLFLSLTQLTPSVLDTHLFNLYLLPTLEHYRFLLETGPSV